MERTFFFQFHPFKIILFSIGRVTDVTLILNNFNFSPLYQFDLTGHPSRNRVLTFSLSHFNESYSYLLVIQPLPLRLQDPFSFLFYGSIFNQFNPFFALSSEILWFFSLRDDVWWLNDDFSGEGFFFSVRGRPSWSVHVAIKSFLILMTHQSMGRKFPTTLRISSSSGRTFATKMSHREIMHWYLKNRWFGYFGTFLSFLIANNSWLTTSSW